ncbi:hypothetical protein ETD86_13075 [Nonomuraea turkmeniaca]|uniref:Uncharacterized protein n=1 Tax=Nonomuraea turkmeniaca TaxID=103838 RepID=A0A5S4FN41_9ACTN|nr:hypothetical protein [Nonomuraea turkmeniaca]TMR22095.1 hypothetical protein ETD86_13075 [Nonomuraea turkmeniaca]
MTKGDTPNDSGTEASAAQETADEERSPYEYDLDDAPLHPLVEGGNLVCAEVPGCPDFFVLLDKDNPDAPPRIAGAILRKAGLNI